MALYKAWNYVNENSSGTKVGTLTMNGQSFDVKDNQADTSVTFSSRRNTTNTSAASGTLRRVGKTVNLIFSATLENALAASTWLTIGTLPSGYLPTENIYTSAVWIGGTVAQVYIGTGSAIQVWSPQAQGAGAVVRGSVTWFVA